MTSEISQAAHQLKKFPDLRGIIDDKDLNAFKVPPPLPSRNTEILGPCSWLSQCTSHQLSPKCHMQSIHSWSFLIRVDAFQQIYFSIIRGDISSIIKNTFIGLEFPVLEIKCQNFLNYLHQFLLISVQGDKTVCILYKCMELISAYTLHNLWQTIKFSKLLATTARFGRLHGSLRIQIQNLTMPQ